MINLTKENNTINLSKDVPEALNSLLVGLGWDAATEGQALDLDASVIMLSNGGITDYVYFNQLTSKCESIKHQGDCLTGEGEGDDEQVMVNLSGVPSDVDELQIVVNIFDGESRNQDFSIVKNSYIHLLNTETKKEIAKYDIVDSHKGTLLLFGKLVKENDTWSFVALEQEIEEGLQKYLTSLNGNVAG